MDPCHRGHSFHCFSRLYFIFLTRSLLFKSNFHTITHLSQKRMNKEHHWYWGGRLGVLDLWGQSKGTVVLGRCGPYPTTTRRRRPKGLSVPTPQQQLSNYWLQTPRRGPTQRTDGTPRCSGTARPPSPPTSPPSTTRRPPSSASTAPAPA